MSLRGLVRLSTATIVVTKTRRRGDVLTEVELTQDTLRSRLEIPLSHVLDAEADTQVAREWQKGLRAPGTHVPGGYHGGHVLPGW